MEHADRALHGAPANFWIEGSARRKQQGRFAVLAVLRWHVGKGGRIAQTRRVLTRVSRQHSVLLLGGFSTTARTPRCGRIVWSPRSAAAVTVSATTSEAIRRMVSGTI
jgi:hypothetical protein